MSLTGELFELAKGMASHQQVEVDTAAIKRLDFDLTCVALIRGVGVCGRPAAWWATCATDTCKGVDGGLCDPCLTSARKQEWWSCTECGIQGGFDVTMRVTPIGGAA